MKILDHFDKPSEIEVPGGGTRHGKQSCYKKIV
jgi:hypothetical protein